MNRTRAQAVRAAGLVALMLVLGVGGIALVRAGGVGSAQLRPAATDNGCGDQAAYNRPPRRTIPADSVLVSAAWCIGAVWDIPGDGQWSVGLHQVATTGLEALAGTLRLPSLVTPSQTSCFLTLSFQQPIVLTDQKGRRFQLVAPTGSCGIRRPEVSAAIDNLGWQTVRVTKQYRLASELSVTSGCPDKANNLVAYIATAGPQHTRAKRPVSTDPRPLRVCRYNPGPDQMSLPIGVNGPVHRGQLVGASTVDGPGARTVLTAAAGARPATGHCGENESPFADVYAPGPDIPILRVELSGCYRALLAPADYLRQLDPAVTSLLA
jgi:hypothetical protein